MDTQLKTKVELMIRKIFKELDVTLVTLKKLGFTKFANSILDQSFDDKNYDKLLLALADKKYIQEEAMNKRDLELLGPMIQDLTQLVKIKKELQAEVPDFLNIGTDNKQMLDQAATLELRRKNKDAILSVILKEADKIFEKNKNPEQRAEMIGSIISRNKLINSVDATLNKNIEFIKKLGFEELGDKLKDQFQEIINDHAAQARYLGARPEKNYVIKLMQMMAYLHILRDGLKNAQGNNISILKDQKPETYSFETVENKLMATSKDIESVKVAIAQASTGKTFHMTTRGSIHISESDAGESTEGPGKRPGLLRTDSLRSNASEAATPGSRQKSGFSDKTKPEDLPDELQFSDEGSPKAKTPKAETPKARTPKAPPKTPDKKAATEKQWNTDVRPEDLPDELQFSDEGSSLGSKSGPKLSRQGSGKTLAEMAETTPTSPLKLKRPPPLFLSDTPKGSQKGKAKDKDQTPDQSPKSPKTPSSGKKGA